MGKGIIWEPSAQADLRAIDQVQALRILKGIGRYLFHEEGDVKMLRGIDPPEYRLRVGDYRVRFYDIGPAIRILSVKHRRDAYR